VSFLRKVSPLTPYSVFCVQITLRSFWARPCSSPWPATVRHIAFPLRDSACKFHTSTSFLLRFTPCLVRWENPPGPTGTRCVRAANNPTPAQFFHLVFQTPAFAFVDPSVVVHPSTYHNSKVLYGLLFIYDILFYILYINPSFTFSPTKLLVCLLPAP